MWCITVWNEGRNSCRQCTPPTQHQQQESCASIPVLSSVAEGQTVLKLVLVSKYGNVQLVHILQQWYVYLTVPIAHLHLQVQQQC